MWRSIVTTGRILNAILWLASTLILFYLFNPFSDYRFRLLFWRPAPPAHEIEMERPAPRPTSGARQQGKTRDR